MIAVVILCAIAPQAAEAAKSFDKVATIGGQFLKIGIGARATGMGSSFVAVADDASAVYWNPAGISRLSGSIATVNHTEWPTEIKLTQAAYIFNLGFMPGMFAVQARSLYLSDMERTTVYHPDGDGTFFDAGDMAIGLTYSRSLTDKFSAGVTANFVHSGLDDISDNVMAFDFGTLYDTGFRSLRIGMAIQNIGGEFVYIDPQRSAKVPTVFRVGASMTLLDSGNKRVPARRRVLASARQQRADERGRRVLVQGFRVRPGRLQHRLRHGEVRGRCRRQVPEQPLHGNPVRLLVRRHVAPGRSSSLLARYRILRQDPDC
jgi:hypothetical protein